MSQFKYLGVFFLLFVCCNAVVAQQLSLGKTPYLLSKSAVLELNSDNQGLLLPRISDTSLINVLNPADGMIVYFTPSRKLMIRSNGAWQALTAEIALSTYWSTLGNATSTMRNIGSTDNNAVGFITSNAERMRISNTGMIGIGITDPTNRFVVKDTIEIRRTGSNLSSLLFTNTSGSGDFRIGGDGGDIFWQGGGGRNLQMGAYWGIVLSGDRQTTAFPSFSNGLGGTNVLVQSQRNASIAFAIQGSSGQTANLTEWRNSSGTVLNAVNSNGNVGIGTSSPSTALHVVGTNPLTLSGVQLGTSTTSDSLLTITSGLVRKLPVGGFQTQINGTGFVKASGNTISFDNNNYTVANTSITGATRTKITYDSKGLVTAGADATTSDITEGTNLYFTDARVRATSLTGLSTTTATTVVSTDNVLAGLGKLQGQINSINGAGYLTGNQTITLTGDVTGSGSTSITTTIGSNRVTNAMIRNSAGLSVLGRSANSSGAIADITAANDGEVLRRSGTTLGFGTVATAGITNSAVTYAKMQNVSASSRLLGRASSGSGVVEEITIGSGLSLSGTTLSATASSAWSLTGNSGIVAASNFIGTTDAQSLRFRTNNVQRIIVDSLGNIGIGSNPAFTSGTNRERFLIDAGTISSYNLFNAKGSINNYLQLNVQNQSNGAGASSDIVATADNGDESNNYIDMGINSSTHTTGFFGGANDAYLYNMGQNLYVGTGTSGKVLAFMTGGGASSNERMRIDGTGNVGIGTTSPGQRLDVNGSAAVGNVMFLGANGSNNGDLTSGALVFGGSGTGEGIASKKTSGGNQYGLDFYAWGNIRMSVTGAGNVGIGTTTPADKLSVAGIVAPTVDNSFTLGKSGARWSAVWSGSGSIQTSDARLKTNIADLKYGLKEVVALRPVSYNWKDKPTVDGKIGLIAQEVRKIVPEVVIGDETKENLGMNYAELVPVLINAIKQQQQQIDTLKKEQQQDREALLELQDLKKQIQELAAEIKPNKK